MCRHTHSIDFALKFPHTDQPHGRKALQSRTPRPQQGPRRLTREREHQEQMFGHCNFREADNYVEKHKAKANKALPTKHPAPKARGATKSLPEGRPTGLSANSCGVCLDLRSERPTEKPPTRNGTSNKLGRYYRLEHMLSMPKALGSTPNTK